MGFMLQTPNSGSMPYKLDGLCSARRIGNIVLMTHEQDQTLQTKLGSYNDVRDFWSFTQVSNNGSMGLINI